MIHINIQFLDTYHSIKKFLKMSSAEVLKDVHLTPRNNCCSRGRAFSQSLMEIKLLCSQKATYNVNCSGLRFT